MTIAILISIIVAGALGLAYWGWRLIREDNLINDADIVSRYPAEMYCPHTKPCRDRWCPGYSEDAWVVYRNEWDTSGFHVIDEIRLIDDDGPIKIEPRHRSDDFLQKWEAEWNREATRIRFEELQFHMEIAADFAMWQLELEKIGSEVSATR